MAFVDSFIELKLMLFLWVSSSIIMGVSEARALGWSGIWYLFAVLLAAVAIGVGGALMAAGLGGLLLWIARRVDRQRPPPPRTLARRVMEGLVILAAFTLFVFVPLFLASLLIGIVNRCLYGGPTE